MKYKIVATDFDGTLLSSQKKLSDENRKAIVECRENGCIMVGITARNLSSIKSVCSIEIFDYLIINNGTYIFDVNAENGEYLDYLRADIVKDITKTFLEKSDGIDYCALNKYYSNKTKLKTIRPFHVQINGMNEINEEVARINIFGKSNDDVYEFKKSIDEKYPELQTIVMLNTDDKSSKRWVAINPSNCNKAIALKMLAEKLGLSLNDVLFFGDSTNDIEVITQVGCGVAMANAISEVKKMANDITLSNDENGVADYIHKIIIE
ncbi:MAG: Cof-type HAD-IIB family hydrolase [Clostridia bacterium]|nr:Cof-type HAD-IIB family hydrolase [Clostridia bacterium]